MPGKLHRAMAAFRMRHHDREASVIRREGGEAAGIARKAVEERTGVPVITPKNAAQLNQVVTDLLEGTVSDITEESEEK